MTTTAALVTPGLEPFLKSLKQKNLESSIENLVSLLKRRQICGSRDCAVATARLMMQVVRRFREKDISALIGRVKSVGALLTQAQPREIAVGNIVRRILGVIREEAEEEREAPEGSISEATSESGTRTPWDASVSPLHSGDLSTALGTDPGLQALSSESGARPALTQSGTSFQPSVTGSVASMFDLLSASQANTPGTQSPSHRGSPHPGPVTSSILGTHNDIKGEVLQGIEEIIDELSEVEDQIAAYAVEHIHSAETILVYGTSITVQKFLLRAASKRRFTVIHAEAYPNGHHETYQTVTGKRIKSANFNSADADNEGEEDALDQATFAKPLVAAGITVILISDAALFALMARVNKVLLGTHVVLANGGLIAAAGVRAVAQAARAHRVPVVVATGVYKLSPLYPFDFEALIEHGDASNVVPFQMGELVDRVDVVNPLFDYVPPELVDLYVTNLGGHAPSYLYRIVAEHYRKEDTNLT